MSLRLGQEPTTGGREPTESLPPGVSWRGRFWHMAGGDETPPPPQPDPVPAAVPPATPPAADPPVTFDAAYVAELRKEAAANRKKASDLEAKLKEQDDAKLSETEKLAKRASDAESRAATLEAQMQAATVRMEVERQARRLSVVDEEAAYVLMDKAGLDTAADDFGKSVERRLKALVEAKPWLVAAQPTNGHQTPPGPNRTPRPASEGNFESQVDDVYQKMRQSGGFVRW